MKSWLHAALIPVVVGITCLAKGQSCSPPKPMTDEQKAMVTGKWVGYYEVGSNRKDFTVTVDFQSKAHALTITNPPAVGTFAEENLRICHNGSFHFRTTLTDGYFEFDGVPGAKEMKGVLVVQAKEGRKTGEFVLHRSE